MFVIFAQIPVYEGAFEGLVHVYGEERDGYFHGKDGFNDIPFESTPDANGRVQKGVFSADAIRSIIGRNPGWGYYYICAQLHIIHVYYLTFLIIKETSRWSR